MSALHHEWMPDGYCRYCHNVHKMDHDARGTCSGGFRCRRTDPEDMDIAGTITNGGDVVSDADPGL